MSAFHIHSVFCGFLQATKQQELLAKCVKCHRYIREPSIDFDLAFVTGGQRWKRDNLSPQPEAINYSIKYIILKAVVGQCVLSFCQCKYLEFRQHERRLETKGDHTETTKWWNIHEN